MSSAVRAEGNVSHREQQMRMRVGVGIFALTLCIGLALVQADVAAIYRSVLVIPFWMASVSFLSSVSGTCSLIASQGKRHTCDGIVRIADKTEAARLREAAHRTLLHSIVASLLATIPFILIS